MKILIPVLGALALLVGCEKPADVAQTATAEPAKQEIAWFEGSVDEAFTLAKQERKPIYLYWGAVWCPPCQEIKHTVFESADFLALSELFIPVYLDGDTERAQAAGERFGVQGYPTMIVFSPAGEEITRIPGGIDISQYNTVLELSLNRMRSTRELVELAMNDPAKLTGKDFTQLAYYSWGQDFKALPDDAPDTLFRDLAELAEPVAPVASARLFMQYLVDAVREDSEESPVRLEGASDRLAAILADDELTLGAWDYLAYWPEITGILDVDEATRTSLEETWQAQVMSLRHAPSLSTAEQLAGWLPRLYYHFHDDNENNDDDGNEEPLPAETVAELEKDIEHADRVTTNAFARQSVVNQIRYLYQQAKMFDEARALLLAELEKSAAPYYFMSSLGSLAEKQEKPDEAVDWYRRAYEASEGAATRFQWGASYVRALIRLKPEEKDLILTSAESLFDELQSEQEVFSGRNFRVLRSLKNNLAEWQEDNEATRLAERFVAQIATMCEHQQEGSLEKENCESLVTEDSTS